MRIHSKDKKTELKKRKTRSHSLKFIDRKAKSWKSKSTRMFWSK